MNNNGKVVFITGTSSGHGNIAARLFAQSGYNVCATMRNISGANSHSAHELEEFGKEVSGNISVVEMDVTSSNQVSSAIKNCITKYGGIDVVINNAGIVGIGWQEEFSIEQFQNVMDVNLYGPQRVYKEVLPHMREQKSGLFLNVTTIGTRLAMPLRQGPYSCAKWALEALSERYHQELSEIFNIDSVCIQPSPTSGTNLLNNSFMANDSNVRDGYPDFTEDRYYRIWSKLAAQMSSSLTSDDIDNVAIKMLEIAESKSEDRPIRVAIKTRCILGYYEVCSMNEHFQKNQKKLEDKWLRGDISDFWEGVK
ncbi:MAG: NAD(P)-dependent dehydrogenase (short-subunit alcohol dehydrogenase family) [Psychrobacter glaciei]|jgi:NAD(P)-dependent dehydrogenase (short-subunit alcohol dehydrogenase family)